MTNANVLEYKGYAGSVEFSSENNILFGKVIGINGLISYEGESVAELREDFKAAVDDYLEICKENQIYQAVKYTMIPNIHSRFFCTFSGLIYPPKRVNM